MIPNNQQEWIDTVALGGLENRVIAYPARLSGNTILNASEFNKLTWGIITAAVAQFTVEGSMTRTFAVADVIHTIALAAATLCTPYNLPAPQNRLGYVVINYPYIRLRLQDGSGAGHATTRFYAKAWE